MTGIEWRDTDQELPIVDALTPAQRDFVTALRSGGYEQGYGRLRANDAFCCLGVAVDRYTRSHPQEAQWRVTGPVDGYYQALTPWSHPGCPPGSSLTDREEHYLPKAVQAWLGLNTRNPALPLTPEVAERVRVLNSTQDRLELPGVSIYTDPNTGVAWSHAGGLNDSKVVSQSDIATAFETLWTRWGGSPPFELRTADKDRPDTIGEEGVING